MLPTPGKKIKLSPPRVGDLTRLEGDCDGNTVHVEISDFVRCFNDYVIKEGISESEVLRVNKTGTDWEVIDRGSLNSVLQQGESFKIIYKMAPENYYTLTISKREIITNVKRITHISKFKGGVIFPHEETHESPLEGRIIDASILPPATRRYLNPDEYFSDEQLDETESRKISYRGREGTVYSYDSNSQHNIVFVPSTTQDSASIQIITQTMLSTARTYIKKTETENLSNINLKFIGSGEEIKIYNARYEQISSQFNSSETNMGIPAQRSPAMEVLKSSAKSYLKAKPKIILRSTVAAAIPVAGLVLTAFKFRKLYKHLKAIKEDELAQVKQSIDNITGGEDASAHYSNLDSEISGLESNLSVADANESDYFALIDEGTDGELGLNQLDNFMRANGFTSVDLDGDGFADQYLNGETIVDPLSVAQGNVPQEDYDRMSNGWNNLQSYESWRDIADNLEKQLEPLTQTFETLGALINQDISISDAIAGLKQNNEDLLSLKNLGIGFGIGSVATFAITYGLGLWQYKKTHGSFTRMLSDEGITAVLSHNIGSETEELPLLFEDREELQQQLQGLESNIVNHTNELSKQNRKSRELSKKIEETELKLSNDGIDYFQEARTALDGWSDDNGKIWINLYVEKLLRKTSEFMYESISYLREVFRIDSLTSDVIFFERLPNLEITENHLGRVKTKYNINEDSAQKFIDARIKSVLKLRPIYQKIVDPSNDSAPYDYRGMQGKKNNVFKQKFDEAIETILEEIQENITETGAYMVHSLHDGLTLDLVTILNDDFMYSILNIDDLIIDESLNIKGERALIDLNDILNHLDNLQKPNNTNTLTSELKQLKSEIEECAADSSRLNTELEQYKIQKNSLLNRLKLEHVSERVIQDPWIIESEGFEEYLGRETVESLRRILFSELRIKKVKKKFKKILNRSDN